MVTTLLGRSARIAFLSALSAPGVLVACAPDPPPRAAVPVSIALPPPTAEPAASAAPASPPVELPPEIPRPPPGGCALATQSWLGTTPLQLGAKGPVFAQIEGGRARLVLPQGSPAQGAYLEADQEGVTLRGIVRPDAFELHPTRPVLLARTVVLQGGARLVWSGGGGNRVLARFAPLRLRLHFSVAQEATADLACDEVGIDRGIFEPRPPGLPSKPRDGRLKRDRDIPVSALPDDPPGAVLWLPPGERNRDDLVQILESHGKRTRILYWLNDALVIGWIATDALGRPPRAVRDAAEFGMIGFLNSGVPQEAPPPPPKVTCPADLALVAEHEGVRATVGLIHAGTPLVPRTPQGDFTRIDLASPGKITLVKGTALLVRSADLAACSPPVGGASRGKE